MWAVGLVMCAFLVTGQPSETNRTAPIEEPVEPYPVPSFPCDAGSIREHSANETIAGCPEASECYASKTISSCGADSQCCAPVVHKCKSGASCFATRRIEICMPWACCCAPLIKICLSPSCSEDFPACTAV
ncbi:unnamed protein product [Effrenium voratum]|nr:unnamed protein product [Effrenium voratum]